MSTPRNVPRGGTGHVALVGAGPGDPGLITDRGRWLVMFAEVLLYDRLVDSRLLKIGGGKKIYVGKEAPGRTSRDAQQTRINDLMVRYAKAGRRVVRLKGGDPFIFGRGGEEAQHLAKHGIPFEVVPGVTAALGAAATTGIPFTHRGVAQEVTFATAVEGKHSPPVNWKALGALRGTLVFYMGTFALGRVAKRLIAAGRKKSTPVAVVERATTPRQRTITGTLSDIASKAAAADVKPPSLVIVGDVVRLRPALDWFESRPLRGKRVLNLRPWMEDDPLSAQLEADGAEIVRLPGLELRGLRPSATADRALRSIPSYDWVVLTSKTAAFFFSSELHRLGLDARAFGRAMVAAIGVHTGLALEDHLGLKADLVPAVATSEGMLAEFLRRGARRRKFLLLRAEGARPVLAEGLKAAGATVSDIALYRGIAPKPDPDILAEFVAGQFDVAVVTSGEIARNLNRWLGRRPWPEGTKLVTIGPVTSAAVAELGWKLHTEARHPHELSDAVKEALTK